MCDPTTLATIVIAGATCLNVVIAGFQWDAMRRSAKIALKAFESGTRPFIGVTSFSFGSEDHKTAQLKITFENFGTIPADEFSLEWDVYLNAKLLPNTKVSANPTMLLPHVPQSLLGAMDYTVFTAITQGTTPLEIIVHVSYTWGENKTHTYNEKHRYDPEQRAFMNLGQVK
jgi:hypothetical protein